MIISMSPARIALTILSFTLQHLFEQFPLRTEVETEKIFQEKGSRPQTSSSRRIRREISDKSLKFKITEIYMLHLCLNVDKPASEEFGQNLCICFQIYN